MCSRSCQNLANRRRLPKWGDLHDLGLEAARVAPDQKEYPRCVNPDDYHVATQLTNKETWWLATTTEVFESMAKDANGVVLNIPEGI